MGAIVPESARRMKSKGEEEGTEGRTQIFTAEFPRCLFFAFSLCRVHMKNSEEREGFTKLLFLGN